MFDPQNIVVQRQPCPEGTKTFGLCGGRNILSLHTTRQVGEYMPYSETGGKHVRVRTVRFGYAAKEKSPGAFNATSRLPWKIVP